jgi:hypothetical protein
MTLVVKPCVETQNGKRCLENPNTRKTLQIAASKNADLRGISHSFGKSCPLGIIFLDSRIVPRGYRRLTVGRLVATLLFASP